MRVAAVQLGCGMVRGYSKTHHKEFRAALVPAVWQSLHATSGHYVETVVNGMDDDAAYDSDGEEVGLTAMVCALLEFVCEAAACRPYRKDIREGLPLLVADLMLYMQLPGDTVCSLPHLLPKAQPFAHPARLPILQLEVWDADANRFLAEDEDDAMTYTVRSVCTDVLVCWLCEWK